jgi:hypothetical protein
MPVSTDPFALGLTWSALLLATTLYGLMVRRRAIDRRRVASEIRGVGSAFHDGLSRMGSGPTDAPPAGVAAASRGQHHDTAGAGDPPVPPQGIRLRSGSDMV